MGILFGTQTCNGPSGILDVKWFETWSSQLEGALRQLPEMELCSHELYRKIITNPGPTPKRIALVSEQDKAVAVVALRNRGGVYWTPVTHWILPGDTFPYAPGFFERVLRALGVHVHMAYWRWSNPPEIKSITRNLEEISTHQMLLSEDFERFWRQSSCYKSIRKARNRCRDFTFAVNQPGALEWTIKNWDASWRLNGNSQSADLEDRQLVAHHLQEQGNHFTLTLCDNGQPIAGETYLVHDRDLVSLICYRDFSYEKMSIGVRLLELIFYWAAESGYRKIDLGRTHDYKYRWAPVDGKMSIFGVCPEYLYRFQQVKKFTKSMKKRFTGLAHRILPLIYSFLVGLDNFAAITIIL